MLLCIHTRYNIDIGKYKLSGVFEGYRTDTSCGDERTVLRFTDDEGRIMECPEDCINRIVKTDLDQDGPKIIRSIDITGIPKRLPIHQKNRIVDGGERRSNGHRRYRDYFGSITDKEIYEFDSVMDAEVDEFILNDPDFDFVKTKGGKPRNGHLYGVPDNPFESPADPFS